MSAEALTSFIGLSMFGIAFGVLIPDNSCKNALRILLVLIIAAALLKVVGGLDLTSRINDVFGKANLTSFENDTYGAAGKIIEDFTEDEVLKLVEEFSGRVPSSVECFVTWVNGEFVLGEVVVLCQCQNSAGVREYLALKLGVEATKIRVINTNEKVNNNAEGSS